MENIKIQIVEDNLMVAQSIKHLLSTADNFEVVAISIDLEQAYIDAMTFKPNIILMDVNMGNQTCYNCLEKIFELQKETKVIALTSSEELDVIQKMLELGASGYLTKSILKDTLFEAIHKVIEGEVYICEEVKNKYFGRFIDEFIKSNPDYDVNNVNNLNDLRNMVDERIKQLEKYSERAKSSSLIK